LSEINELARSRAGSQEIARPVGRNAETSLIPLKPAEEFASQYQHCFCAWLDRRRLPGALKAEEAATATLGSIQLRPHRPAPPSPNIGNANGKALPSVVFGASRSIQ